MGEDGWHEMTALSYTLSEVYNMKLLNKTKFQLAGISNIVENSSENVQRFFTKYCLHLEIINLTEEDVKSLQMPYLAFKGDLTTEFPNSAQIFRNTYVNKRRNIPEFVVIKSLHTDCITLQLVAIDSEMVRIKDFLKYEPRIALKRKKAEYKACDEKFIGKFFKSEFTRAERKLCYQLKKHYKYQFDIYEMLNVYYKDGYSFNDVVDAYGINYYNIADIIDAIDEFRDVSEFRDALIEYQESLQEEDNSF